MTLLFVHDHPFYAHKDAVYSGGGLPAAIWSNYLLNFSKVTVYARISYSERDKKIESSSLNVSFYLTKQYYSVVGFFKNKQSIKRELISLIDKVDVVLVRLPSVLGLVAADIAFSRNKYVWVEQVGNAKESLESHGSYLGKFVAYFFHLQNRNVVKRASFVSYVTEYKLQKDYPASPNSITVSLSNVIINFVVDNQYLKYKRLECEYFRIGVIGGFDVKYKGQDILLRAIFLLDESIKRNIKVSFVGKGDYTWVLNLANDLNLMKNIEFIGALEAGKEISDYLSKLSLYVQPSLTEGMPRSIIEAMAMGCPVIGSDVGGIPEVVSKEFVHKRGDILELSSNIKLLYLDRDLLHQQSVRSAKMAVTFLKSNLDFRRDSFYSRMNEFIFKCQR